MPGRLPIGAQGWRLADRGGPLRRFHADHLRAQVGQQYGGIGAGAQGGEIQDFEGGEHGSIGNREWVQGRSVESDWVKC